MEMFSIIEQRVLVGLLLSILVTSAVLAWRYEEHYAAKALAAGTIPIVVVMALFLLAVIFQLLATSILFVFGVIPTWDTDAALQALIFWR